MKKTFQKLFRNHEGIALIEFVMVFPVLFMLVFVAFELTRYILIVQKLDKATYVLADMVGQMGSATLTGNSGNYDNEIGVRAIEVNVLDAFDDILAPFNSRPHGMRISSVVISKPGGTATANLRWRMERFSTGMASQASIANAVGAPLNFTQNGATAGGSTTCYPISWTDGAIQPILDGGAHHGENFILGEFYFDYQPILQPLITAVTGIFGMNAGFAQAILRRDAFLIPRAGFLLDLPNPAQFGQASATFPGPSSSVNPTTLLGERSPCL